MFKSTIFVISCLFALVCKGQATEADSGSHEAMKFSARQQNSNSDCTTLRIPWNLCGACPLKPFKVKGGGNVNFNGINRFDIYDLSSPQCRHMLNRYVQFNPCDDVRRKAVSEMDKKGSAKKQVIYFMYSVCELCCDCVPIGSRENDYEKRKEEGTLINIKRGNCAAHFFYDTCRIWPKSSKILGLRGNASEGDEWCDDFKRWQFSPAAKGWLHNNNVGGITNGMAEAMDSVLRVSNCGLERTWKDCVRMERGQNRVWSWRTLTNMKQLSQQIGYFE